MVAPPVLARRLHTVIEPFHAFMYFAPEVQEQFGALGLDPRTQGYFAGRAAPMGRIGGGAAQGPFHGFNPMVLAHMLPAAWDIAGPEQLLTARAAGIEAAFQRVGGPADDLAEATELALAAQKGLSFAGRPLAGANADVPLPETPWAALWQATAVLREHRGDGHLAVLISADIDRLESLVMYAAWQSGVSDRFLKASRVYDDAAWSAAVGSLQARGWLDDAGSLTVEGRDARDDIEAATDRVASAPYVILGEERSARLFTLLRPILAAMNNASAFKKPVTVPDPWPTS